MKLSKTIFGATLITLASTSFAGKSEFGDMCATGLAMGKEVPTDCSVNMMVGDKMYCFSGEKPKQMFMDDQAKMLMKAEAHFKEMNMKK